MRGFAITIDSLVALTFFFMAMIIISAQTYQPSAPGDVYLKQLTLDVLTVLEKTGDVNAILAGNTTPAYQVVEATPRLACMQVTVLNGSEDIVALVVKSGCNQTAGLDMQTAERPVLFNNTRFIIKSESWLRKAG